MRGEVGGVRRGGWEGGEERWIGEWWGEVRGMEGGQR